MFAMYSTLLVNALRFAESKDKLLQELGRISNDFNDDEHLTGKERSFLQALALTIAGGVGHTPDFILEHLFEFNQ